MWKAVAAVLLSCNPATPAPVQASSNGSAPTPPATYAFPSPHAVKTAIVACDLPDKSVHVRFEQDMQEDVVWIARDSGPLTTRQMSCVANASLQTRYYVYFRDQDVQKRYDYVYQKMSYDAEVTDARLWLRSRNLLATLPTPQTGQPLSNYTEAVEEFCGVTKGTLLVAVDDHTMTYTKDGLGRLTPNGIRDRAATDAQFDCVLNATSAADLRSHDVVFGIISSIAR